MDGSTYTLTSNHLTYDGKSLDLTLESMSETDKEQGQLLSSQGTQITAIQGQIASKIWQQDIDTATGEMDTKYSNLEQTLNGFKTEVGNTFGNIDKKADDAQAAANSKRRVFTTTPTPPYDVGDLWSQGGAGEIMVCKNAKTENELYDIIDWEKASKYTDDTRADKAYTKAEQTADKFTWIVKSGTNSSDFTLTDRVAQLTAQYINLNGLVTISGLDAAAQGKVNSAASDASSALSKAKNANDIILSWCKDNDTTVIDGGKIYVDQAFANEIFAKQATIGGFTIGTSALHNGTTSLAGADNSVYLGLDGISCGTKFKVDKAGALTATSGTIGGFRITSNSLITNNKIGLYSSGRIAVTGQSSYVTSDGSGLYSTLSCSGGTIVLDSNLSGTLDGLSGSNGRFHLDFKTIMGYGEGGASSDPLLAWFVVNNTNKQCTISAGGSLYVNDPEGNRLFGVLGSAGIIQVASLHCSKDIIFNNASRVGTDDAPSGRHTLANNTSISFLNSSGTRVRGIGLGNTDNFLIGDDSGIAGMYGYITAQNNIGFYAGTSHDQCFASIYSEGKRYFQSKPIYDRTTSSGTAVRVNSNGTLYRYASSSMRYKEEITCQLSEELNPERLYDLNVWQYKYREGHLDKGDQRYGKTHIGLLAEDVKQHYPIAANYNEDGDVEDWSERYLIPPMLKLIQMQHEEIEAIKAELEEMRAS